MQPEVGTLTSLLLQELEDSGLDFFYFVKVKDGELWVDIRTLSEFHVPLWCTSSWYPDTNCQGGLEGLSSTVTDSRYTHTTEPVSFRRFTEVIHCRDLPTSGSIIVYLDFSVGRSSQSGVLVFFHFIDNKIGVGVGEDGNEELCFGPHRKILSGIVQSGAESQNATRGFTVCWTRLGTRRGLRSENVKEESSPVTSE